MKNPHRFTSKVTGNGKVIVDNSIRTAYSSSPEALKASAYFMYKKVTVAEMAEIQFGSVSKISYNIGDVSTEEDCITVKTPNGNIVIHVGTYRYTAIATLREFNQDITGLIQTVLLDNGYSAKTIDLVVNIDESLAISDDVPEEHAEVVSEAEESTPTYELTALDEIHIPRYDIYVVTEVSDFAPHRVEIVAGQILSSVQHITGTSSTPYTLNTAINEKDFRYRIVSTEGIVNVVIDIPTPGEITNEIVNSIIQKLKTINVKSNLVNFISITLADFDKFEDLSDEMWGARLNTVECISWANLEAYDGTSFNYKDVSVDRCYTEYGIVNAVEDDSDLEFYAPVHTELDGFDAWTAKFGSLSAYAIKRKGHNTTPLFIAPIKGVNMDKVREIVRVLVQLTGLTVHEHFCMLSLDEAGALNTALISNFNKEKENSMDVESLNLWYSETDHIRITTDEHDGGIAVNHIFRLADTESCDTELFKYKQIVGTELGSRYLKIGVAEFVSSKYSITGPVFIASVVTDGVAFINVTPLGDANIETYEVLEADSMVYSLKELEFWKEHDGVINDYVVAFSVDLNCEIIHKLESVVGMTTSTTDEEWSNLVLATAGLLDVDEEPVIEESVTEEPTTTDNVHEEVYTNDSTDAVEETKPNETEEIVMSKNKPFIEVPVAAHIFNYSGVDVASNVNVVTADDVDSIVGSTCVGVIVDFNDYFKASEIMAEAIERGLPVYQLRYIDGGASNEIIRLK